MESFLGNCLKIFTFYNFPALKHYLLPSQLSWNLTNVSKVCKIGLFWDNILAVGRLLQIFSMVKTYTNYSSSGYFICTESIAFVAELCENYENTSYCHFLPVIAISYQFCMVYNRCAYEISRTRITRVCLYHTEKSEQSPYCMYVVSNNAQSCWFLICLSDFNFLAR